MGSEKPSSRPEKKEEKKEKPKTTLYAPFQKEKHQRRLKGVRIDVEEKTQEEQIELDDVLDQQLSEATEKKKIQEELVARFGTLEQKMKPGKLWTKVEVSDEEHTIVFSGLTQKERWEKPKKALKQAQKNSATLSELELHFETKGIAGRPEPLFLSYKAPLTLLLEGGGKIEEELHKLVTEQFAGTKKHYENIRTQQKELQEPPPETETFEVAKKQIRGALEKKGATVSEVEGEKLFAFVAHFPESSKQLHISTVEKETWNVAVVEHQNLKKEQFNLRPQEIISSHIEREP